MKKLALVVVLALIAFGGGIGVAAYRNRAQAHPYIPLPAGNKAATKEFLNDYDSFVKEKDDVLKIQRQYNLQYRYDALKQWGQRLAAEVPQGYTFDEVSRSFEPTPVSTAPAPQVAPQPAPAVPGKK